jgi:hypothetical protein
MFETLLLGMMETCEQLQNTNQQRGKEWKKRQIKRREAREELHEKKEQN